MHDLQDYKYETPGQRLRHVRTMLRLSRAYIQKKYGLPADTLRAWECGRARLTAKGLDRCVIIYRNEGMVIARNWILTGEGLVPKANNDLGQYFTQHEPVADCHVDMPEDVRIAFEADYFKKINAQGIVLRVANEEMLPFYHPGDTVGGCLLYGDAVDTCLGKDCIVKTKSNECYFRRINKNKMTGGFNLVCLNPSWGGTQEPVLYDVDIAAAAIVIWHRRHYVN